MFVRARLVVWGSGFTGALFVVAVGRRILAIERCLVDLCWLNVV